MLDCMTILDDIWKSDQKYAREDGIRRCWRKADILPISWNTDIDKELGSNSLPMFKKTLDKSVSDELCAMMKSLQIKTKESEVNVNTVAIGLQDSFASEDDYSENDMLDMLVEWVGIEDEPEIIDACLDDDIKELEELNKPRSDEELNVADDEEIDEAMTEAVDESDLMTHLEASEALRKLKLSCGKLGVPDSATIHLDRFVKALHKAKAEKPKQDKTLHAFFQAKPKPQKK